MNAVRGWHTMGMSTNLVNYLEDRLNQGNVAASNNVTNWSGTCYITPLIGAFLADSYLGRYWTIASFVVIYIIVSLLSNKFHLTCKLYESEQSLPTTSNKNFGFQFASRVSVLFMLFILSHSKMSSLGKVCLGLHIIRTFYGRWNTYL